MLSLKQQGVAEKLRSKGLKLVNKGKFEDALRIYNKLLEHTPEDTKIWVAVGDLCRKLGRPKQAIQIYTKAAAQYAVDGDLIRAIGINKSILDIDPGHKETQDLLARLYSEAEQAKDKQQERSKILQEQARQRKAEAALKKQQAVLDAQKAEANKAKEQQQNVAAWKRKALSRSYTQLSIAELEAAMEEDSVGSAASTENVFSAIMSQDIRAKEAGDGNQNILTRLPNIPIFSDIDQSAFVSIISGLTLHHYANLDPIIREGDTGDSFHVLASGSARVVKQDSEGQLIELAILPAGSFFGEFAFLTGTPRTASIIANEDCQVLEFRKAALDAVIRDHPQINKVIERFYQQRIVATAITLNPIFQSLPDNIRDQVLNRCTWLKLPKNKMLAVAGTPSSDLFFVVTGRVAVNQVLPTGMKKVRTLKEGDYFGMPGVMGLSGVAATYMTAASETRLFRMKNDLFQRLVSKFSDVAALVQEQNHKTRAALMNS